MSSPAASISSFIIGDTRLTTGCAEILQAKQVEILGIFTNDPLVQHWAARHCIPCFNPKRDAMVTILSAQPFDVLFSIINSQVLKRDVLSIPRLASINYHDSPLPAYAGLNATSWAIINGEVEHGVSWHIIEEGIDSGDIVASARLPIREIDTAQLLNLRCTKTALELFPGLVDDMLNGTLRRTPQTTVNASYFGLYDRPFAAGCLQWEQHADRLACLGRGLLFGNVDNPLCLPKFMYQGKCYTFAGVETVPVPPDDALAPGQILDANPESAEIVVACGGGAIKLSGISPIDATGPDESSPLPWNDAPAAESSSLSYPFDLTDFDAFYRRTVASESFWVARLTESEPLVLPYLEDGDPVAGESWDGDAAKAGVHQGQVFRIVEGPLGVCPLVQFSLFLARITTSEHFFVPWLPQAAKNSEFHALFVNRLPLPVFVDLSTSITENIRVLEESLNKTIKRAAPLADVYRRFAGIQPISVGPISLELEGNELLVQVQKGLRGDALIERFEIFCTNLEAALGAEIRSREGDPKAPAATAMSSSADLVKLGDICILSENERHSILDVWNDTDRPYDLSRTYIQHLNDRLPDHADAVAVRFRGDSISYRQLASRSAAVARYLTALELPAKGIVAVSAERDIALIPVLLGIFAAGHAYLPLEPGRHPPDRLQQMLSDADVRCLINFVSETWSTGAIPGQVTKVAASDIPGAMAAEAPTEAADAPLDAKCALEAFFAYQHPDNNAYVMYTSGSTGIPKGVMVSQRNLVNHNLGAIDDFELTAKDNVLQFGALGFDLSVEEIFPILLAGGTLVLLEDQIKESPVDFTAFLKRERITFLDLPTAYWHAMVGMMEREPLPACVRLVVIGGEKASLEHFARWKKLAPSVRLLNTYGPTETTIIATTSENLATIGRPVANTKAYILDKVGQLCPPGVLGDLFIGGAAVSKGYLNRPEQTAAVFLTDPFLAGTAAAPRHSNGTVTAKALQQPAERPKPTMYKTGDLALFEENGEIRFHGRADNQVKINGFRIEIDEIEQAVLRQPGIVGAAVSVFQPATATAPGSSTPASGTQRKELVAYYVCAEDTASEATIRGALRKTLPSYMLPRHILRLESIPVNKNGKVDTKALPAPQVSGPATGACIDPEIDSPLEIQVASALRKVFGFGIQQYDRSASFSDLGGDSLTAINLLLELEKSVGRKIPVEKLYGAPSMASFAMELESLDDEEWSALVTLKPGDDSKPPLFLIHTTPGDVLGYINLVDHLDDRPIYGFQAFGLKMQNKPHRTIEEMAAYYVGLMREVNPAGPYYLCGWCYGGIVALEMASQLERSGAEAAILAAIETWGQPAPTVALKLRKIWNLITWGPAGWQEWISHKLKPNRRPNPKRDQRSHLDELDFIGQRFGSTKSREQIDRMKALYALNIRAAEAYVMPKLHGRLDLIMINAQQNPGQIPDATFWWRGISSNIHCHRVEGDHGSILKMPYVEAVAEKILARLEKVDRSFGR